MPIAFPVHRLAVRNTLGLTLLLAGCSGAIAQDTVYQQEVVTDAGKVGLGWFSSAEERPNKNFRRVDDFTLAADAAVGSVSWWGQSSGDFENDLSNFTSFRIEFYASRVTNFGELRPVRSPFMSETFAMAELIIETTGRTASHGGVEHKFSANLGDAVELAADTTYFFSVSASHVDPSRDAFQWGDAEEVNGYGGSWSYADSGWQMFQDTDSAFQLRSVPAPSGASVLGAAMLIGVRRRR